MSRSFYHYIQTLKGPNIVDPITAAANAMADDIQFPKHSNDYEKVASYLEMNVDYLSSMDIFDRMWEMYLHNN